jgi:ABC-2 type transport system ATP-binding protein
MPQIIVENLTKTFHVAQRRSGTWGAVRGLVDRKYRTVRAIEDISFSIDAGELVGYIGPNGAGKSTTVKVLAGILVPDSGQCRICNRIPWKARVANAADIGVVFGQRTQLWWDLPVVESFELLRDIYRVSHKTYRQSIYELIQILGLEPLLDVPVRQLSLGQRMRCDLAAALIHNPSILFLDEPTIGLDAVSKLAVRDFIRKVNREYGTTVILTTHDMDDIEALCSRVMLIGGGRLLLDGTLDELRASVTSDRWLTVDLSDENCEIDDPEAKVIRHEGNRFHLSFDPERVSPADLICRIAAKYPVRDLFVENPPIENIIARLYRQVKS